MTQLCDVTIEDILGHLRMAGFSWCGKRIWEEDAEAEKLYELVDALQEDESREKETVLRKLCSKWGLTDRDDGETKRPQDISQQLAEIAKRAYIQWRSKPRPTRKRKAQRQDRATVPKKAR